MASKLRVKDMRCTVDGCDRMQIAKGICTTHYGRMRRTGTLLTPHLDRSWFDRAIEKSKIEGDCWVFVGAQNSDGYGTISIDGKQQILSRVAFNELVEPLTPGMFVCHKCDNPPCWNPDHLFQGTASDNTKDMLSKGRARPPWGERAHTSKLTESDVRRIRNMIKNGVPRQEIAAQFGVTRGCVWGISSGRNWSKTV